MREMSREEKIEKISAILLGRNMMQSHVCYSTASEIYNIIEPQKIKTGMIGKFYSSWDSKMYGKLYEITNKNKYLARGGRGTIWDHFIPMTPDEIKRDFEEMINEY